MTGSTLYIREGNNLNCVKVRHTGQKLRDWISTLNPLHFKLDSKKLSELFLDYYLVNNPYGNLKANTLKWVSEIPNIWNDNLSVKQNIQLFEQAHLYLYTDNISDDYNCSYEDYVYLIDFDKTKILTIN